MNERIKEIHNQTMYWVADNGGLRISDRIPTGYTEKLAELIVRECSRVAKLEVGTNRVCDAIEKHFGVES